jgi:hypothetical protein
MYRFERTSRFLRAALTALFAGACAFAVAGENQPRDNSASSSSKETVVSAVSGTREAAIARANSAPELRKHMEALREIGWTVADVSTAKVEQRAGEVPVAAIKAARGEEESSSAAPGCDPRFARARYGARLSLAPRRDSRASLTASSIAPVTVTDTVLEPDVGLARYQISLAMPPPLVEVALVRLRYLYIP